MKILEILTETPIPAADVDTVSQIYDKDAQTVGAGQEGTVIKTKKSPNVYKITGIESELKKFGYMQYVLLSKKYSGVNPYFPKILSITQHPPMLPGRISYIVEMELLSNKLPREERIVLAQKIFYGEELEEILAYEKKGNSVFEYVIEKAVHAGPTEAATFVKDKQFLQAINLIHIVKKKTGATIDMHDANYMIRQTNQGPQIVLTDPLAN
jgi:hypothetical protein